MASSTFWTSPPDRWNVPRPYQDACLRLRTHGPVQPMQQPGKFDGLRERLFRFR